MRTLTVAALGVAALLLVGTAVVGAVLLPDLAGTGYDETTLHTFETTGPACPAEEPGERPKSGSYARSGGDGQRLSVVDNVTARGASGLDADVSEIGPGRYHLSLSRTGSAESAACTSELRYNATLNVSQPDDYTLVVTLDGELQEVRWAESSAMGGAAGASSSVSAGGADAAGDGPSENTTAQNTAAGTAQPT